MTALCRMTALYSCVQTQYTSFVRRKFREIEAQRPAPVTMMRARSAFGVSLQRDWWGRDSEWAHITANLFPTRLFHIGGDPWPKLQAVRFDETISVVNAWFHCTGFGTLQRMLIAILKTLQCADLQTFYLLLDSFDRAGTYANSAPTTNSKNFFMTPKSPSFKRRITKMVSSYGHLFVAADALEMIMGYDNEEATLFRDWVGTCTAYLFDEGSKHGGPPKNKWDSHMRALLRRSVNVLA